MPAGSIERTNARKEEIINACEKLYRTMGFKNITLKEIGKVISFSRTSIYNYYQTKEEIFLDLLKREYENWISDIKKEIAANEKMSDKEIAALLAKTLEKRPQLLKILSMNHYDLEENSRLERLIEFKSVYGASLRVVGELLAKYKPTMKEEEKRSFIYSFFPFMFGIYPYAVVTDKQQEAMEKAGVNYIYSPVYDLIYKTSLKLLG